MGRRIVGWSEGLGRFVDLGVFNIVFLLEFEDSIIGEFRFLLFRFSFGIGIFWGRFLFYFGVFAFSFFRVEFRVWLW